MDLRQGKGYNRNPPPDFLQIPAQTGPMTMEYGEAQYIKTSPLSLRVMLVFGGEVWSKGTHDQCWVCLEEHKVSIPQNK